MTRVITETGTTADVDIGRARLKAMGASEINWMTPFHDSQQTLWTVARKLGGLADAAYVMGLGKIANSLYANARAVSVVADVIRDAVAAKLSEDLQQAQAGSAEALKFALAYADATARVRSALPEEKGPP